MRFCGLSIADPVPDANTLWDFREALIAAGAFETLFEQLDKVIKDAGYIPMGGQIVDANLVASPRQRNTDAEKEAIKSGKSASEIWPDKPAKAAQKDTDARWTVKSSKGKIKADGTVQSGLTIPAYGYKAHISIAVEHGFIRRQKVTDAAAHDGARLRKGLVDPTNTASGVWADTAYRSAANEAFLADRGKVSRIYRRKTRGQADARADSESQRQEIQDPRPHRACLRAAKRTDAPFHPQRRPEARRGDDCHGQHCLQSRPLAMVGDSNCVRLIQNRRKRAS
jgi:IS5 family transposase